MSNYEKHPFQTIFMSTQKRSLLPQHYFPSRQNFRRRLFYNIIWHSYNKMMRWMAFLQNWRCSCHLGLKNYITSRILSIILIALLAASLFIYLNFFWLQKWTDPFSFRILKSWLFNGECKNRIMPFASLKRRLFNVPAFFCVEHESVQKYRN